MKSNRTQAAPPKIEDLGDGSFYYNFDVVEGETQNEEISYNYQQVRCNYPIVLEEIQAALINENYNHIAEL
jgi:hypothetical protein